MIRSKHSSDMDPSDFFQFFINKDKKPPYHAFWLWTLQNGIISFNTRKYTERTGEYAEKQQSRISTGFL